MSLSFVNLQAVLPCANKISLCLSFLICKVGERERDEWILPYRVVWELNEVINIDYLK